MNGLLSASTVCSDSMTRCLKRVTFGAGAVLLCGAIAMAVAYPRLRFEHDKRLCMENLRQIGLGSAMWSYGSGEGIAPSLQALTPYVTDPRRFVCPGSGHVPGGTNEIQRWTDYGFVSEGTESDPPAGVLAFCAPLHHRGTGAVVLFMDRSVRWVPAQDFARLTNDPVLFFGTSDGNRLAELRARRNILHPRQ